MAYQLFMKEIFKADPSNAMISFSEMMKAQIIMPAELMTDPINPNLFDDFSRVAQKIGVYTAVDYAHIIGAATGASAALAGCALRREPAARWRRPAHPAPCAPRSPRPRAPPVWRLGGARLLGEGVRGGEDDGAERRGAGRAGGRVRAAEAVRAAGRALDEGHHGPQGRAPPRKVLVAPPLALSRSAAPRAPGLAARRGGHARALGSDDAPPGGAAARRRAPWLRERGEALGRRRAR